MTEEGLDDESKMEQVKAVFRVFDCEQSKTIPRDRLLKVLGSLDPAFTQEALAKLLEFAPAASTGDVRYEEFIEFVKSGDGLPAQKAEAAEQEKEESEESESDDDFVEFDEEEERKKMKKIQASARRASFYAGGASEDEIRGYKAPFFPKPDEVKSKIAGTLRSCPKLQLLGIDRLNSEQLDEMVMAFAMREVDQNQDVIKQGEAGNCLYVIEAGDFDIFISRTGDDGELSVPVKVASFGPGCLFGELAILYNSPRAATVRCATSTGVIWSLDREPFQMLLKKCGIEKVEQYSGWLTQVEILKVLNVHEIATLATSCACVALEANQVLMKQGDPGNAFFILEEGQCAAFFDVAGEEKLIKSYTKQGEYFGELALINNAPRKATVRAISDAVVLKVEKESFDNLLGPIIDRLRERAADYPQYAEFLQ